MKKIFIFFVIGVLLLLDWAALSDIRKGEQNPLAEYVTLAGSVVIIVAMISYSLGKNKNKSENELS